VASGLRQAIKIGCKTLLPGLWRFGLAAHAAKLQPYLLNNISIFTGGIKFITQ
jgi:hypothetical protein